jgi:hypothetical protein
LAFNGIHGVICQKIGLFITTAVKISNPTYFDMGYDPFLLNPDHVYVSLDAS